MLSSTTGHCLKDQPWQILHLSFGVVYPLKTPSTACLTNSSTNTSCYETHKTVGSKAYLAINGQINTIYTILQCIPIYVHVLYMGHSISNHQEIVRSPLRF